MADPMEGAQSSRHITPQDRLLYQKEYMQGADQFKRALDEYSQAPEVHKKEAFRQVMVNALQIMNETARGLKSQSHLSLNKKIEQEFATYQTSQDESDKSLLAQDLEKAKKL